MEESNTATKGTDEEVAYFEAGEQNAGPKLNILNFLNVLFYIANAAIVNIAFIYGLPEANSGASETYQSIVAPVESAFIIWTVIYVFQALWAVLQLLPSYRAHPYVRNGVSYWYISVCILQIAWVIVFTYELIWLSFVTMVALLVSLFGCVLGTYYQYNNAKKTLIEYWLLLFPFSIELGWIIGATLVNINILVVWYKASAVVQLTFGICSLAVLVAVAVVALFVPDRPNYTVAGVISWAAFGIYSALKNPLELITETFDATSITSIQYSALVVCIMVVFFIAIRLLVALYRKFSGSRVTRGATFEENLAPVVDHGVSAN